MGLPWMFVLYFHVVLSRKRGWAWVAGESTPPHIKKRKKKEPTARYLIDQYGEKGKA
jgi:hypothetical protein